MSDCYASCVTLLAPPTAGMRGAGTICTYEAQKVCNSEPRAGRAG